MKSSHPPKFTAAFPFSHKLGLFYRFPRFHGAKNGVRRLSTKRVLSSSLASNTSRGDLGEFLPTKGLDDDSAQLSSLVEDVNSDSLLAYESDKVKSKEMDSGVDFGSIRQGYNRLGGSSRPVGRGKKISERNPHSDTGGSWGTSGEIGGRMDSGLKRQRGGDFGGDARRSDLKLSYSRSSVKGSNTKKKFDSDLNEVDDVRPSNNEYDEMLNGKLIGSFKDSFVNDAALSDDDLGDDVKNNNMPAPSVSSLGGDESYLSESRFDQCLISPLSLKGVKAAGYEKMTIVQEATLPFILEGKDVLAKARTGTGKTVAFLLPSIEVVLKTPPVNRIQKYPPITVLVICPTRELASQAAKEADMLLKYHPSISAQVVIGGTRISQEQRRLQANPCQILIATPGRLIDHITNTDGFGSRLKSVKVLVLDEADQLLDMGFRKAIEEIMAAVPKQRQTLLFSATIPPEVRQICHIALKRDHEFVNTVLEGTEETHSQVKQMHLVAPLEKQFSLVYAFLKGHISDDSEYKVLVFCVTAMVTKLVAEYLRALRLNVREIHSRKSQSHRTKVSDEFRNSKGMILVTSDVSARGVDYPDVTLVIQIGVPSDRQQYIHRLGRTGRKGKEGKGILLLAPWEKFFLYKLKDLPITQTVEPAVDPATAKKVEIAMSQVDEVSKVAAYQAWLGYYNSNKDLGKDKHKVVELANHFSKCMGFSTPPAISKIVVHKMGLKNIPGLHTK